LAVGIVYCLTSFYFLQLRPTKINENYSNIFKVPKIPKYFYVYIKLNPNNNQSSCNKIKQYKTLKLNQNISPEWSEIIRCKYKLIENKTLQINQYVQ